MTTFGVVLTVLVMLGVVVLILLFEKKRARGIQHDLREMSDPPPPDMDDGADPREGPQR